MSTFPRVGNTKSRDPRHRGTKQEEGLVKRGGHKEPNLRDLEKGTESLFFFLSVIHRVVSELFKERSGRLERAESQS